MCEELNKIQNDEYNAKSDIDSRLDKLERESAEIDKQIDDMKKQMDILSVIFKSKSDE